MVSWWSFWPVDFSVEAYMKTFKNSNFIGSMWISVIRTILGTFISMVIITTAGYSLSKDFPGRNALMWLFVFTMLFSGGLIPSYLLVTKLGLKDTISWRSAPGAFGAYNLILIMNFFKTIPKALEEAAFIDGASFFGIFWRVYLPLSLSRFGNCRFIYHGWTLELMVRRHLVHVQVDELSPCFIYADHCCARLDARNGLEQIRGGGLVRTEH